MKISPKLRLPHRSDFSRFGMPFDLRNEVQTFQRFINKVLHGLDFCYAYMDILIASSTKEEHLKPEGIIPCIHIQLNQTNAFSGLCKSFLRYLVSEEGTFITGESSSHRRLQKIRDY